MTSWDPAAARSRLMRCVLALSALAVFVSFSILVLFGVWFCLFVVGVFVVVVVVVVLLFCLLLGVLFVVLLLFFVCCFVVVGFLGGVFWCVCLCVRVCVCVSFVCVSFVWVVSFFFFYWGGGGATGGGGGGGMRERERCGGIRRMEGRAKEQRKE